jgi:hypothetical protein
MRGLHSVERICGFSVQFALVTKLQLLLSFHRHHLHLIILWIIGPWDPGIYSSRMTTYMNRF